MGIFLYVCSEATAPLSLIYTSHWHDMACETELYDTQGKYSAKSIVVLQIDEALTISELLSTTKRIQKVGLQKREANDGYSE